MQIQISTRALRPIAGLTCAVTMIALVACSSGPKRPVLYPNTHLQSVGKPQADREVEECFTLARDFGASTTKDGNVGGKAAAGAVIGGVGAGAWGLVRGDAGERAAAGAAAGAATGATRGAMESSELNPTYKRFVERCLSERGYDVIGWD